MDISKITGFANWKVSVRCFTYNHNAYIIDAMDGFCMQTTDFPYVCCIVDDASVDGQQEIIKNYIYRNFDIDTLIVSDNDYGSSIIGRHKTNINCFFSVILLNTNHHGNADLRLKKINYILEWEKSCKFVAICEGDDYWTDPLKLQKQVDFLESHPDYGMCYTKVKNFDQTKKKFLNIWGGPYEKFEELLLKNTIPTLSVLLKRDLYEKYYIEINPISHKDWLMGDYPLWLYVAKNSKIKFINNISGVYRILPESASHSSSLNKILKYMNCRLNIQQYFCSKYSPSLRNRLEIQFMKDFMSFYFSLDKNQFNCLLFFEAIKNFELKSINKKILKFIVSNKLPRMVLKLYRLRKDLL